MSGITFDQFVQPINFEEERAKAAAKSQVYQPGWKVVIHTADGEVGHLDNLVLLEAYQDRLGARITYGMRPEGYDSFVIAENGGGGSITLAYFFKDGKRSRRNLMVAALLETRNAHTVLNLPRAFLKPGKQHLQVAQDVAAEEFGLDKPFQTVPLGNPANSNSAFFFNQEREGCRFFAMRVNQRALQMTPENGHFIFKNEVQPVDIKDASTKRLLASVFMPPHEIRRHPAMDDMFTLAGLDLLMSHLFPIK